MIPKSDNLESTNDFSHIRLCNDCYKIIAKILANRIKQLLNKIMSPLQEAFALVMLTHEIMHSLKKEKGKMGYMKVKIDMEKTYDRLEWDFIRTIMSKLSFHYKWI